MKDKINQIRRFCNVPELWGWDDRVSDYCRQHSQEMASQYKTFHAIPEYLNGWAECVGSCHYCGNIDLMIAFFLYQFLHSEEHRPVILYAKVMAVGYYIGDNRMYITIRGMM